ncbi:hypothetical protein H5410_040037 [Solanum commersonii]|uniref:Uncharacterized protein n=1 Tax=Solanum commersonii TaxID=4109 RepID=A0A9J5XMQ5_SOLCO|nr:hypothetical protein H5410_040037 [Solanum commersonii]
MWVGALCYVHRLGSILFHRHPNSSPRCFQVQPTCSGWAPDRVVPVPFRLLLRSSSIQDVMEYIESLYVSFRLSHLVPFRSVPVLYRYIVGWTEPSFHRNNSSPVHPNTGQQPGQTISVRSCTDSFWFGGPIPVRCPVIISIVSSFCGIIDVISDVNDYYN